MAPPGRRKGSLITLLPFLILLLFTTTAHAVSAVLGIDLGTEYIKAAVAKPGSPIDIVLTKDSRRKEAAALAFKPSRTQINNADAFPERLYGADALALSARYPTDVFTNLKTVLGLPSDSQEVKDYFARYSGLQEHKFSRTSDGESSVGFKSQNAGKDSTFMVEELLAMQLKNIKANAEAAVGQGSVVTDVVITYPAYYTVEEKRAVELAADLAGLRVLGLISDGLAVGLNYATHRTFDSVTEGGKPEYHVVYDMGAGSTTATVLRFQGRTIKGPTKRNQTIQEVQVMGIGADRTFGGDMLNDLIVKDMIDKFLKSPRMEPYGLPVIAVRKHGKTMARLWKDAEKMRQVLSANSKAFTTLEGLFYEDVTFKYSITREEFETFAVNHAARVSTPLEEALSMAGLQFGDLESIILHGGAIRTPFVQRQLEQVAGGSDKIRTNVNADEAAVMGAAFKAASISPAYRVKDIRDIDIAGSSYSMSWSSDGKVREQKVFIPTSQIGVEKQVTVKALQDLVVDFKLETADNSHVITSVELTNLTKSGNELKDKYDCAPSNISTVLTVKLHSVDGTPDFASGSVSCRVEKLKEGSVMDGVKGLFGFGSKKGQEVLQDDDVEDVDNPSTATPLPISDPTSSGTTVSAASTIDGTASSSATTSTGATFKPTTVTIPLAFKTKPQGLNQPPVKEMSTIKSRLTKFDTSDRNAMLRSEALNVLEGFTYRARDYLEDESFVAVTTKKVRAELEKQLSSVSEWLYGDGVDAKIDDFKAKLKSLQAIVDPALKRKDEGGKREKAVETLRSSLSSATSMVDMVKESIEKAAKDAASSASSAASSVADKISSAAAPSASENVELDDDPYSTGQTESIEDETELPIPKPYGYTEEDFSTLSKAYDTAKSWLDEKLALQAKLNAYDDPAVLVADIEAKTKQLQNAVSNLIMRQVKMAQPPKPKKAKASSKKDKSKKSKTSSTTESDSSTTETASAHIKDEL